MLKTGVLVIGAGPTGLMMACQLTLQNIPFIIVEKDPKSTTESRAIGIQARTLEILEQMGIAQKFVNAGYPATNVDLVIDGKKKQSIPLSGLGQGSTKFPFLLILEQSKTETFLLEFLQKHNKPVCYNTTVTSITQDNKKTTTVIKDENGKEEVIEADYIAGCDGAHSIVRHSLGINLAGKTYKQSLFVLDCSVSSPILSRSHLTVAFSDNSFAAFFPLKNGHWRIVGEIPPRLYGKDSASFEEITLDFAKRMQMEISLSSPNWYSLYHAHHRCVEMFQKGRCFLLGDAAHIHSPVGAQGMNTGLQDAYNLSWKIAYVYKKLAGNKLLETYNQERLPFAKRLVETTDRVFSTIITSGGIGKIFRTKIAPRIAGFILGQKITRGFIFKTVSQIGISYHSSNLSKNASFGTFPKSAPVPGDRLPYAIYKQEGIEKNIQDAIKPTHFQLLLFTGNNNSLEDLEQIVKEYKQIAITKIPLTDETKHLYHSFGIMENGYYFVRPDMYVAFRSTSGSTAYFSNYLSNWL